MFPILLTSDEAHSEMSRKFLAGKFWNKIFQVRPSGVMMGLGSLNTVTVSSRRFCWLPGLCLFFFQDQTAQGGGRTEDTSRGQGQRGSLPCSLLASVWTGLKEPQCSLADTTERMQMESFLEEQLEPGPPQSHAAWGSHSATR